MQVDDSGIAPLRILCIADEIPWPERTGYRIRLANMLRGLAHAGAVDLMILHSGDDEEPSTNGKPQAYSAPIGEPVQRTVVAHVPIPRASLRGVATWIGSGLPRRIA